MEVRLLSILKVWRNTLIHVERSVRKLDKRRSVLNTSCSLVISIVLRILNLLLPGRKWGLGISLIWIPVLILHHFAVFGLNILGISHIGNWCEEQEGEKKILEMKKNEELKEEELELKGLRKTYQRF